MNRMAAIDTDSATVDATAKVRRLTEFASDTAHLADQRADLDLRQLVDDLHRDLIELQEER